MLLQRKYSIAIKNIYRKAKEVDLPKSELKRIKLSLQVNILALIACFIFGVLDALQQRWNIISFDILSLCMYYIALVLFKNGKFQSGKVLLILPINLLLVMFSSMSGPEPGTQFVFFPIMIGSLIIFSKEEYKHTVFLWLCSLTSFVYLEYINYSNNVYPINNYFLYVNYLFCFIISQTLIIIFVLNLDGTNRESEKKLKSLNKRLIKKNNDLKKINAELDSFVYKASHNLRSPLTSLMGLIELLKNETDLEKVRYYLSLEEITVNKLDSYISDILDIMRNSRLHLKPELVNLSELIDSSFIQMNYMENSNEIKKIYHIEGSEFHSDKMRLTNLMNNLISNAIRYSDPSKREQLLKISAFTDDKICTIKVWDNGLGIEKEHLNKIFNLFYRATEKKSGSGLGLYIVKETIEKMNGTIDVNSEPGHWTEFIINIPNLNDKNLSGLSTSNVFVREHNMV